MSDSNCNCCCAYLTPPWWVTMGYAPPAGRAGVVYQTPATPTVIGTAPAASPPPVAATPPKSGAGGGLLGGVVGVGKDVGNLGKDILSGNLGSVPGDIVNGISDIIHLF